MWWLIGAVVAVIAIVVAVSLSAMQDIDADY
jgi:hypothetical protein